MKNQVKRPWERLTEEEKDRVKSEMIHFFEKEREMEIGMIAAEDILNFFLQSAGGVIYNKGLADAQKAIEYRVDELKFDLDELKDA